MSFQRYDSEFKFCFKRLSKSEIIYRALPRNSPVCCFAQRQMIYFDIRKMDRVVSGYHMVLQERACSLAIFLGDYMHRMDFVLEAIILKEQRVESVTEQNQKKTDEKRKP